VYEEIVHLGLYDARMVGSNVIRNNYIYNIWKI